VRAVKFSPALCALALGCGVSPSTPPSADEIAAACVTATACGLRPGSVENCAVEFFGVNDPQRAIDSDVTATVVRCLARAGADCPAATACEPGLKSTDCGFACSGDVLRGCLQSPFSSVPFAFDCSAIGQHCVGSGGPFGGVSCGERACSLVTDGCAGDRIQRCDGVAFHERDCAPLDATCGLVPLFGHTCIGRGPACATSFAEGVPLRCDAGDTLVACGGGHETRQDCARLGGHCFEAGGQPHCAFADQCDPQFQSACAGAFLVFCNNGVLTTVNCIALGFGGCDPSRPACMAP
jgi:hypothetical protein